MARQPESRPRFLTIEQVAEELNVGAPLVRTLLKTGELRGIQVGGRGLWRVGAADVEEYINSAYALTAERIKSGQIDDDTDEPAPARKGSMEHGHT